MTIDLQIAGYSIRLSTEDTRPLLTWPLQPFEPFLVEADAPFDIEFIVKVVERLPEISHGPLRFDACHGLWKLYESEVGYVLEAADTKWREPRSRCMISPDYSRVEVWVREQRIRRRPGWSPMFVLNPIAEMCLLTRVAREGGVLLHASGVLFEDDGWVFCGPSGAGKSTLSDLLSAGGGCVLSDERVIIRKIRDEFRVFGTPWVGTSRHAYNGSGPLTRLFCIRHGSDRHTLETLPPRALSQFILQQCFLPYWDQAAMDGTLSALAGLIEHVDCDGLAFLKSPDVVDFLQTYSFARAASSP